jgi:deoxycytidylate deaminase
MRDKTPLKMFNLLTQIAELTKPVGERIRLVSAIVDSKGNIVSLGAASKKTHPLQKKYQRNPHSIYLHSEIDAIRKAVSKDIDLSVCNLYICRIRSWEISHKFNIRGWGSAKPCEGCQRAIKDYKIKKVYYTLDSKTLTWNVDEI